jgi:hypothetical protein
MIDTPKFGNRLRPAGFSQEQAEAVAEAWGDHAREDLPLRLDLAGLDNKITRLDGKVDKLTWMVGFALAGIVAIIARLLLLGP